MRESMGVANPTGAMKVKRALEVREAGSRFPFRGWAHRRPFSMSTPRGRWGGARAYILVPERW